MYAEEKKEEEDLGKQRKEECGRNEWGFFGLEGQYSAYQIAWQCWG